MNFEQKGDEGRRSDGPVDSSNSLVYYGNRVCPFAQRAWWTLVEKGIEHEYIHIDLGDKKPAWYQAQVNSLGTVPCIYDHGKPVFESLIVSEYLEEKFKGKGTALLPEDPLERATIRFFISQWSDKVQGLLYRALSNADPQKDDDFKSQLHKGLKVLNDRLVEQSEGPYFLGKNLSLADIAIASFLERFSLTLKHYVNIDLFDGSAPRVEALLEEVRKRPAFQKTNAPPEVYIKAYAGYARKQ